MRNRKKRDGKWGEKEEGDEFYCSCVMEKDTGIFSRSHTLSLSLPLSHTHSLMLFLSLPWAELFHLLFGCVLRAAIQTEEVRGPQILTD